MIFKGVWTSCQFHILLSFVFCVQAKIIGTSVENKVTLRESADYENNWYIKEKCIKRIVMEEKFVYNRTEICEPIRKQNCANFHQLVYRNITSENCDWKWVTECHIDQRVQQNGNKVQNCIDENICEDKILAVSKKVPFESCELIPLRDCQNVTSLYPELEKKEKCYNTTVNFCHWETYNKTVEKRPVIKRFCTPYYNHTDVICNPPCDAINGVCKNVDGVPTCECLGGFNGNGIECSPIKYCDAQDDSSWALERNSGLCYKTSADTFDDISDARTFCQDEMEGQLATVNTQSQIITATAATSILQTYWTGLNDLSQETAFQWEDGTTFTGGNDFMDSSLKVLFDLNLFGGEPVTNSRDRNRVVMKPIVEGGDKTYSWMVMSEDVVDNLDDKPAALCQRKSSFPVCPIGWTLNSATSTCFYLEHSISENWEEAKKICFNEDIIYSSLAKVAAADLELIEELISKSPNPTAFIWTGGHAFRKTPTFFTWFLDSSKVEDASEALWLSGSPEMLNSDTAIGINPLDGVKLTAKKDDGQGYALCSKSGLYNPSDPLPARPDNCPHGWMRFGDKCFMTALQWVDGYEEAEALCSKTGGTLPVLTREEMEPLVDTFYFMFSGLHLSEDGLTWSWLSSPSTPVPSDILTKLESFKLIPEFESCRGACLSKTFNSEELFTPCLCDESVAEGGSFIMANCMLTLEAPDAAAGDPAPGTPDLPSGGPPNGGPPIG